MAKATKLTGVSVDEISVVDDPANPEAKAVLIKSRRHAEPDADEEGKDTDGDGDGMKPGKGKTKKAADCDVKKSLEAISKAIDLFAPSIIEHVGSAAGEEAAAMAATVLKERTMTLDEMTEALEKATKAIEERDAEITKLKGEIEVAKTAAKTAESDGDEDVFKNMPEALRKRFIALEASSKQKDEELEKMRTDREETEAIEKAKALGVGNPKLVGPLLLRVRKGKATDADVTELERMLKATSAQAREAGLFKSVGSSDAEEPDAEAVLKAAAVKIQKANAGMSFEKAYTKALEENPEIYDAYLAKRAG